AGRADKLDAKRHVILAGQKRQRNGRQAEQSPECAEHGIAGRFTLWRDTARRGRDDRRALLLKQFLDGRSQGPALGDGRKIVRGRNLAASSIRSRNCLLTLSPPRSVSLPRLCAISIAMIARCEVQADA